MTLASTRLVPDSDLCERGLGVRRGQALLEELLVVVDAHLGLFGVFVRDVVGQTESSCSQLQLDVSGPGFLAVFAAAFLHSGQRRWLLSSIEIVLGDLAGLLASSCDTPS